ncbi:hypothetical protein [Teichococcus vastitatis]|uniref:hypothetical protein n=1 Tax=Teichococcus vastitatis TaxID=2307076 RepID=UPI0013005A98|nr:hypothetical protein [Pseudoroseomonas vastitatis]
MKQTLSQRLRTELPYAIYKLEDGSELMVNRNYHKILLRTGNVVEQHSRPVQLTPAMHGTHFYDDGNPPWECKKSRKACEAKLREWQAFG